MGWHTQAIFDNSALMGLPFFLSQDITELIEDRGLEKITPNILEHLKIQYSGNFLRRQKNRFSFELQDDELSVDLNGENLSRITSGPDFNLERAGTGLKDLNESLALMLNGIRNPSQTWALEQFDIARKAFSRGQFQDALTYVGNAIDGTEAETGYRLEFRFHYLKGLIFFGDMRRQTDELVNYEKAQKAFLDAANYSVTRQDKSECLSKAALAACANGQHKIAYEIFHQACEANPEDALAHYLFACINFQRGSDETGQNHLEQACMLDLDILCIALNDPTSRFFEKNLRKVMNTVRNRYADSVRPSLTTAKYNWKQAVSRIRSEDQYETLFPHTLHFTEKVSAELKHIDLGAKNVFEAGILARYFDRDYNIMTDNLLAEMARDYEELAEDLEDFQDQKYIVKSRKRPGIRSFGKIYKNTWKKSSKVTSCGIFVILGILFTIFIFVTMNEPYDGPGGRFGQILATLLASLIVLFILSLIIVPLWYVFRGIWVFFKSMFLGMFFVSKDKITRENFDREKKAELQLISKNIKNTKADLDDAKRLRKDLMKILRPN